MAEERRTAAGWFATLATGVVVGAVETVLAVSLAAFMFSGLVRSFLASGLALYLGGAVVALAISAWRGGSRGVVGSVQDVTLAVIAVVATTTALATFGGPERIFLTVVAVTAVITILIGVACFVLGWRRRANLVRFVPYPVVGGLLAGAGWLLVKGGIAVAVGQPPFLLPLSILTPRDALVRWAPAVAFGIVMLLVVRIVKRPLALPVVLAVGFAAFGVGVLVSGSTIADARSAGWLVLGPFDNTSVWEAWTARTIAGADLIAVAKQALGILAAVFVGVLAISHHVNETESVLDRDLDTNRELRDVGLLNVVAGAAGGIPAFHALGLSALVARTRANARFAGLVAAAVPLAALAVGASVLEQIPRMVAGAVLVFLGAGLIVEWLWDRRRTLPRVEYTVVLVILAAIIAKGFLPGVVLGFVMAVVLFAVNYGRIELVREVAFGDTYRSNVDRPPAERATLRGMRDRVQILRVTGFVFFGSANGLLERIRKRVEPGGVRFLLLDLRAVSGVDSSAVVSFLKVVHLAESHGAELVLAGASAAVREQLARGGVVERDGVVRFEPDLDRGLQRCEDVLLAETAETAETADPVEVADDRMAGMPTGLTPYLERETVPEGTVLIHQDEPPDDVFVLESGRLSVEMRTRGGEQVRVRTLQPGVMAGEIAMYAGISRTADVVVEEPSVVLRLRRSALERIEAEQPELASAVHRWLARTLAERLTDSQRAVEALVD